MNKAGLMWGSIGAIVIMGALWLAISLNSGAPAQPTTVADPAALPGLATSTIPEDAITWEPETTNLKARLLADNLRPQTMEGQALHIHQHLDIFVRGVARAVPAQIGINEREQWLSAIHTHDSSGIIHVEAPFKADFTLGEFFDIWGVYFTKDCIGGYCANATEGLKVYVNGQEYTGDPRLLVLAPRQEIAIVFGTASDTPAALPAAYDFPAGL